MVTSEKSAFGVVNKCTGTSAVYLFIIYVYKISYQNLERF